MGLSTAERVERKHAGVHYTPPGLAAFVARQLVGLVGSDDARQPVRVLDPAVGDGALLRAFIASAGDAPNVKWSWTGFDVDASALERARGVLGSGTAESALRLERRDFLEVAAALGGPEGGLFETPRQDLFDIVISNPPYVRTQTLGASRAQELAREFGLSGRVDLSSAFLLATGRVLRPGGLAGIIVSNRFMSTRAGEAVRRSLAEDFEVLHVWDLGDTRLFDAAVLPAVLLMRRRGNRAPSVGSRLTTVYATSQQTGTAAANPDLLFRALESPEPGENCPQGLEIRRGSLNLADPSAPWRISSGAINQWFETVEAHTACLFRDIGKVRVGVKTTADKVFIRRDWHLMPNAERPELLRRLTTHRLARRFRPDHEDVETMVLYTHQSIGGRRRVVELSEYPRAEAYLNTHRELLSSRTYVIDSGRRWYEIWVPQDPELWARPKLVFRDIAEQPTFWMDLDGTIVNGDCYWITGAARQPADRLWLAMAVANSSFALSFYDQKFNNRLYAGRRRFLSQYVEQFPLPDPDAAISRELVVLSKRAYEIAGSPSEAAVHEELDVLVWKAFGLRREEIAG